MTTRDAVDAVRRDVGTVRNFQIAAATTAFLAFAAAAYQVSTSGPSRATYISFADYFREVDFLLYLLASLAAVRLAARLDLITRVPERLILVGYGLIAIGVGIGLVLRSDPDWFFLLGGPGNLLAGVGFVAWGVTAGRRRAFPWWLAALCAIGGLFAVLFAEVGLSVLIGAFWLVLAFRTTRPSTD